MSIGFKDEEAYGKCLNFRANPLAKTNTDVSGWIKGIVGILATLVLIGGLVWTSANLLASKASNDSLKSVADRINIVEKTANKNTIILEYIKEAVDKLSIKLDNVVD